MLRYLHSQFSQTAVALLCGAILTSASCVRADSSDLEIQLHTALKQVNPEYKNGGTFRFKDDKLIAINLMRCKGISDLSPLSSFSLSSVSSVILYNSTNITDISPLRECQLKSLNIERCAKITDLSPLKGMPLTYIRMYACDGVKDLSALKGMRLKHLDLGLNPQISDISILKGMPLEDLRIDNCPKITDISVLEKMPIRFLSVFGNSKIKSYAVLGTLQLETLYFTPSHLSPDEQKLIRSMKSLKKIGTSWADYRKEYSPKDFWKRFDENTLPSTKSTSICSGIVVASVAASCHDDALFTLRQANQDNVARISSAIWREPSSG